MNLTLNALTYLDQSSTYLSRLKGPITGPEQAKLHERFVNSTRVDQLAEIFKFFQEAFRRTFCWFEMFESPSAAMLVIRQSFGLDMAPIRFQGALAGIQRSNCVI
jgi:hypothetical protein